MAFTKVRGRGVTTTDNYTVGVITATKFVGPITGGGGGINVGVLTATELDVNGSGNISGNLVVEGNLTANGDFTTLNTTLREVELLKVNANSSTTAGIITQTGAGDILNLFDGTTEVLTVTDGGKVGIGTEVPDEFLHLGQVGTNGNNYNEGRLKIGGFQGTDKGLLIGYDNRGSGRGNIVNANNSGGAANRINIGFGAITASGAPTTEVVTINQSGNVGIGSAIPDHKLDVAGTVHGTLLSSSQTSTGVILKLARTGTANGEYGFKLLNDAGNDCSLNLRDEKDNKTRISISSGGNIGINNSTAKYALHFKNAMSSSPSWIHMEVTGDNTAGGGGGIAFDTSASNDASNNSLFLATIKGIRNSLGNGSNDIVFSTSTNGVSGDDGNTSTPKEKVRITNDGKVGIGLTNPSSTSILHLRTSANHNLEFEESSGNLRISALNDARDTNEVLQFAASEFNFLTGKVGINSTSPGEHLDVVGNIDIKGGANQLRITSTAPAVKFTDSDASGGFGMVGVNNTSGSLVLRSDDGGALDNTFMGFEVDGSEKLRIDSSGRLIVGSGTNTIVNAFKSAIKETSGENAAIVFLDTDNMKGGICGIAKGTDQLITGTSNVDFIVGSSYNKTHIITGNGSNATGYIRATFDQGGHFGLGTTIIRERMHLHTANSNEAYLRFTNTTTGTDAGDGFNIGINSAEQPLIWNKEYTDMLFGTHGATRLTISKDGKATFTEEIATPQDYPNYKSTIDFNFAGVKKLDPRITYVRTGPASYIDERGKVVLIGANVPRFDHDPDTGECKGLLIEDSRTNLFPYGTTPGDNWSGAKANSTWTENTTEVKAPDGTYTATKWAFTGTDPYLYHQGTLNANTTYTMSMWVKAGTNMAGDWLQFRIGGATYSAQADSIIPADGTWRRITHTKTVGGSDETNVNIGFEPQTSPSGNPASGDVIYIWGAQLEVGGFASSFIPTNGTTETRFGDFVSITGDEHTDFWNPTEGTYLIDYKPLEVAVGDGVIIGSKRGSNGSGYPWPLYRHDTANTNNFKSYDLDTGIISMSTSWVDRRESWALGFNGTNGSIVRNGTQVVTNNTSMKGLIDANELWLGSSSTGSLYSMHVKRFMYYRKRISDSQLKTLTS